MRIIFACCVILFSFQNYGQIDLELILSGLEAPVGIENAGDERLFIVEREGVIKILHSDGDLTTFLNIENIVNTSFSNEKRLTWTCVSSGL